MTSEDPKQPKDSGEAKGEARAPALRAEADAETQAMTALLHDVTTKMRRRPDAVFDVDHPEKVVPLLPVQELLFAIQEMGIHDSTDLVALTTPEQFQAFLDLSAWRRDRVVLEDLQEWFRVLLELENGPFSQKIRGVDPELIATGLGQLCAVIQVEDPDEDPLADTDLPAWWSPDHLFLLLPTPPRDPETGERVTPEDWTPEQDDRLPLAIELAQRIYKVDPYYAHNLLMETLSGTVTEHEEFAYRWRSGRVADLGYSTYAEALGILQYLDPAVAMAPRLAEVDAPLERDPTEPATLGGVMLEPWFPGSEEQFLEACLEGLGVEARDRLTMGFTYLANRVAAATLASPGDLEAMREVLLRVRRGLNLGLMYLTGAQPDRAAEVLSRLAVTTVFRVGHSLTLKLGRLVHTLRQKGRISLARGGATLLEGPWREAAEGLSQRFPELSRSLDDPPAEGNRPLLTLDDLAHGAAIVQDLAAQWPLCFLGLRFSPKWLTEEGLKECHPHEPGAVRLGDLFRTAVVRHLLGETFMVEALTPDHVARGEALLAARATDWAGLETEMVERIKRRLEAVNMPAPDRLERLVTIWLGPLRAGRLAGETIRTRG